MNAVTEQMTCVNLFYYYYVLLYVCCKCDVGL